MSGYGPYDGYEPNEPTPRRQRPLAPARTLNTPPDPSADPVEGAGFPYARRTWDEEEYTPNEPGPARASAAMLYEPEAESAAARRENPYARPTWDETTFESGHSGVTNVAGSATPRTGRPQAIRFDADADTVADTQPEGGADAIRRNPYARPAADVADSVSDLSARFAPPLKFELPKATLSDPLDAGMPAGPAQPNVYQTRRPAQQGMTLQEPNPSQHAAAYRVEADGATPARRKRRRRAVRRWLLALLILGGLGYAAYVNRAWLLAQLQPLLGEETVQSVNQAIEGPKPTVIGYDAAPTLQVGAQAKKGISAVAGALDLQPYAVTAGNVIARTPLGDGTYDVYLFAAANGQLLGYYEKLNENGFLVCAGDVYYVAQPPYLIDAQGLPLIDPSRYAAAGADAVLWPLMNGWAVVGRADGKAYNYINAKGELLSTLWFSRAYPFSAGETLAYVDTGNVADPTERYALYVLSQDGEMKLWRHAADMSDVLGCAAGLACLTTGEVVRLDSQPTTLCITDDAAIYADCGALVARDPQTGKYGLFVNGEQHYDFAYDSIAPVPSDLQWEPLQNGFYTRYTVTDAAYPLPLSHYFALTKGDSQEMVALSTATVYPLLLND
ncbi:MAG: hypothetical protein VB104_04345 [Candidatus Limiplasma sp.]|nr:hypothetical protein [Candidatus Limiplasma sp.]